MVQMRVNLNCIVWYILMELDWLLKLNKDGENCLHISVTNKKRHYQPQGYNSHFIPRNDNLPAIIRLAKHPAYSGQQILQIAAYQISLLSL